MVHRIVTLLGPARECTKWGWSWKSCLIRALTYLVGDLIFADVKSPQGPHYPYPGIRALGYHCPRLFGSETLLPKDP